MESTLTGSHRPSALRTHLWREWREHRRSLGFLALSLAAVVALLSQLVPKPWIGDSLTFHGSALVALAAAALSVGSDLFATERQKGTDRFLSRVPGARRAAFRAKLLFYVLLCVGAAAYGALLAVATTAVLTGGLSEKFLVTPELWSVSLVAAILCWSFAASTWVKTGALTLPTTALFLCGAAWPVWLMISEPKYGVSGEWFLALIGLALCGALVAARVGFGGGSRRRVLLASVVVGAATFTPAWAWVGQRYVSFRETEPRISWFFLGSGQRYAFVSVVHESVHPLADQIPRASAALVLDLEARPPAVVESFEDAIWSTDSRLLKSRGPVDVRGWPSVELLRGWLRGERDTVFYDGATARLISPEDAWTLEDFLDEWKLPRELWQANKVYVSRAGTGFRVQLVDAGGKYTTANWIWWDPATGATLSRAQLLEAGEEGVFPSLLVRPGRWLANSGGSRPWFWIEPTTLEREPALHLETHDKLEATFDDGALLVNRDEQHLRLEPETGALQPFAFHGSHLDQHGFVQLSGFRGGVLSSTGPSLIRYVGRSKRGGTPHVAVAILNPREGEIEVLGITRPGYGLFVRERGFALVVERGRRLVQIDAETGETTVLLDLETGHMAPES